MGTGAIAFGMLLILAMVVSVPLFFIASWVAFHILMRQGGMASLFTSVLAKLCSIVFAGITTSIYTSLMGFAASFSPEVTVLMWFVITAIFGILFILGFAGIDFAFIVKRTEQEPTTKFFFKVLGYDFVVLLVTLSPFGLLFFGH